MHNTHFCIFLLCCRMSYCTWFRKMCVLFGTWKVFSFIFIIWQVFKVLLVSLYPYISQFIWNKKLLSSPPIWYLTFWIVLNLIQNLISHACCFHINYKIKFNTKFPCVLEVNYRLIKWVSFYDKLRVTSLNNWQITYLTKTFCLLSTV